MNVWLYAAACVVVPAVWGLVMYALFNRFHKKRKQPPPIDYMI